jgi:hypothetical protein
MLRCILSDPTGSVAVDSRHKACDERTNSLGVLRNRFNFVLFAKILDFDSEGSHQKVMV